MKQIPLGLSLFLATVLASSLTYAQNGYLQTNLVSDIPGLAAHTDPNLVNPWGIASSAGSPFWVSDNGTNVSTLYNTSGTPLGLVVSVPPSAPTGVVFNGTTAFHNDVFLFATETGTINGWRGALGTTTEILSSSAGAVYKGIATATVGAGTYIYATDFAHGIVTVLPSSGAPSLPGNFIDPSLPAGYSPFNIQDIGGSLLVTYAVKAPGTNDDLAGPGNGIVDRFDLNGIFIQRFASNGPLNSPWGLALAPENFGTFSNDLLVGNFGDGRINAFNPVTGTFLGTLDDTTGNPLTIEGLWGLRVGNDGNGGNSNFVYFAAGIPGPQGQVEDHGLFGSIASINTVPDSGSAVILLLIAFGAIALSARLRSAHRTT